MSDIAGLNISVGQRALLRKAIAELKPLDSVQTTGVTSLKDIKDVQIPEDMMQLLNTNTANTEYQQKHEGKKPLFIKDYVSSSLGLIEPEEQSILQGVGGQSLTFKTSNKPKPEQVTVEQWVSANARIMRALISSGDLTLGNMENYILHTEQIGEYFQIYDIANVMLYDHRFRELVAKGVANWGQPDIHGISFYLRPKVKQGEKNNSKYKGSYQKMGESYKSNRDKPICREWQTTSGCKWPQCKFRHVCIADGCQKNHPQYLHSAATSSRD